MLYRSSLAELAEQLALLPDKPEESTETTLAALWHAASGLPLSARMASCYPLVHLDAGQIGHFRDLIGRRLAGTPLAYLTGRQHFMGLEMLAAPEALIPRQETQLLAATTAALMAAVEASISAPLVVDVCTGSGNLALALASRKASSRILAADLSAEAVALARDNARHLGLEQQVEFRIGDLLQPFLEDATLVGQVDLLVCNPPYISSAKVDTMNGEIAGHEPRLAFDGGPLGIRIVQRLIAEAPTLLKSGGWLAFEVGLGQARGLMQRMEKSGNYDSVEQRLDAAGQGRVLVGRTTTATA
ncbi:MAG: peptide chain release factor N(5)-glutamine methyltransferase [Rhodocyclaceae bacterium]|nr:MAG: peptide chain release factor N(5)-glutamine methyltransferase [Rhodocyclaceae bacterium]